MSRNLKIVVTGPFSAGKSQFIKAISEIDVVSTEKKLTHREKGSKRQTTVAMDYGRATIGDDTLHLHGTPGQARFDFMWDILMKEMHGFVVVVDSCAEDSFGEVRELIEIFTAERKVPYLIAANKQDLDCALPPDKLRRLIKVHSDVLIMPCTASRKTSVRQVLSQVAGAVPY
ncbi:MAG: ATP/GTP-binding protein [Chloroflexi bacterium]|nr:ATP/GTP-binding protein [Chloroflexota bacterium]